MIANMMGPYLLHFLDGTRDLSQALVGAYDPGLVFLSYAVASLASFAALTLADRLLDAWIPGPRKAWLASGALVLGIGVWAMHFVGMLAFQLPVPVNYSLRVTLLSMVPAIAASFVVLTVLSRSAVTKGQLIAGGVLMGAGIGAMHYTGMAAMRMRADMFYDPALFALSLFVAMALATAALCIKFLPARRGGAAARWAGALVMGLAIVCMHYTAMAAVYFFPVPEGAAPLMGEGSGFWLDPDLLGGLTGAVTIAVILLALAALALAQSGQRYHMLMESVRDHAICTLDPDGCVSAWNAGAERVHGYSGGEIIGRHISAFYPEEAVLAGEPRRALEIAAREGRFEEEGGWRVRKDGSHFWAGVVINALPDKEGNLRGFSMLVRDVTAVKRAHEALERGNEALRKEIAEREAAQEQLRLSQQSLRRLSGDLMRAQDEERRHFGRELHDSVGQYLTTLKMGLDALGSEAGGRPAGRRLRECIELAEKSIAEVRTMSYLLYPPMLEEMGLHTAVSWYLDGFGKRSGIRVRAEVGREIGRLPRDLELALFRVLQESLTNVLRHSGSRTAQVRLLLQKGEARLEIKDHGRGMPPGMLDSIFDGQGTLGVGLRGMSQRLEQLGGRLEIESSGWGTAVTARLPLPAEAPAGPPAPGGAEPEPHPAR